jgi:hypothetical protein
VDTVICKHSSVISLTETCIYIYVQESIIMSLFPWKVEYFIFCSKAENVHVITSSFLDKRSTLKSPMTICEMPGVKSFKRWFSASPLKLLNRISWNLVGSKEAICGCAYYQEIMISWILWELCPARQFTSSRRFYILFKSRKCACDYIIFSG